MNAPPVNAPRDLTLLQRPDASYLGIDSSMTSMGGLSSALSLTKIGGGHTRGGLIAKATTPGFEANDLGLQPRADAMTGIFYAGWDGFNATRVARNWEGWFTAWAGSSFGGDRERSGLRVYGRTMLHNYWELETAVARLGPVGRQRRMNFGVRPLLYAGTSVLRTRTDIRSPGMHGGRSIGTL